MNRRSLALCLLALAVLHACWSWHGPHRLAALLVLVLPPLLLAFAAWRSWPRAGFLAGIAALLWFCHGVMLAWSVPAERGMALAEIALALAVVYAASAPGLRARFGHRA